MKIVMLESLGVSEETMNNLLKDILASGNEFVFCDHVLSTDEKRKMIRTADIAIIANNPLTSDILNATENLKMISVGFTGIDHIDMDVCREKNVTVCNAQGYATDSTAELAVGLMLACLRNIVPYNGIVRDGGTLGSYRHNTLKGKTVGIVGTGEIGRKTASLVKSFGCRLIGYAPRQKKEAVELGIEYTDIDTLFRESDIISLHAPLTKETRNIANRERIFSMKKSAILINCARGGLVDSAALADALNEGAISGAGIDVFESEPPIAPGHPLLSAPNAVLTPHIGYYSEESLKTRAEIVCENIKEYIKGSPVNVK